MHLWHWEAMDSHWAASYSGLPTYMAVFGLVSCPTRLSSSWWWRPQIAPFEKCSIWELLHLRIAPFEKCSIWEMFDLRIASFEKCSIWEMFDLRIAPTFWEGCNFNQEGQFDSIQTVTSSLTLTLMVEYLRVWVWFELPVQTFQWVDEPVRSVRQEEGVVL